MSTVPPTDGIIFHLFRGQQSDVLRDAVLTVTDATECHRWLSRVVKNVTIDDNVICAVDRTSEGQDACQGDSGGPLMFEAGGLIGDDSYTLTPDRSSRWILIGVVSFGCVCH